MTTILYIFFIIVITSVLFTAYTTRRIEKLLPPLGRIVDTSDAQFHVYEKGSGPCILLIHGLGAQLRNFDCGVIDQLAINYRVVAVDRPGSGYSIRRANTSASPSAQADAIAELMHKLNMQQTTVVGHSLGGAVALALAQRHPNDVAALALIAPLTHEPKNFPEIFKALVVPKVWLRPIIAWTLALPMGIIHQKRTSAALFGPEKEPEYFATRAGGLLGARPSNFISATADIAAASLDVKSMVAGYPHMNLPVSILYGRGDQILNPEEHGVALKNAIPNARLTLIEGGHMLPITVPQITASFIQEVAEQVSTTKS